MTNYWPWKNVICCKTHNQIFKLRVNRVTKERISKILTTLKNIIKNNKKLSQKEAMYFAYISIFVEDEYSKEIMIEISEMFSQINKIEPRLELNIHQILKK